MCKVIAVSNKKGGVGKTVSCVNLGIGLAQAGKKVLLIDADPQGSLTTSLGYDEPDEMEYSIATMMMNIVNDGYSKKFYEEHREEISIQKAAKKAFSERQGKLPKVKDLNSQYSEILTEKKKAYSQYRQAKKDMQDYVTARHNIDMILGEDQRKEQEQKKQKEKESSR